MSARGTRIPRRSATGAAVLGSLAVLSSPATLRPAQALPSRVSGTLSGASAPAGLAVSDDERYLAVLERSSGQLLVWDRASFSAGPVRVDVCNTSESLTFSSSVADPVQFWVGCAEGALHVVDVDGSSVPPELSASDAIELAGDSGDLVAVLWAEGDAQVHIVAQSAGLFRLHRVALSDHAVDAGSNLPQTVAGTAAAAGIGEEGSVIAVARSDGASTWFERSGDVYSVSAVPVSAGATLSAVAISEEDGLALFGDATLDRVLAAALSNGAVSEFGEDFAAPQAMAWGSGTGSRVAWVADESGALSAWSAAGESRASVDLGNVVPALLAPLPASDAAVYVVDSGGDVHVASDRPWIDPIDAEPDRVGLDGSFELTFQSSLDGDYSVRAGGGISASSGDELASGAAVAGSEVVVTLDDDALPEEGENRLFVFVESDGAVGLDSVVVTLDTPPDAVLDFAVGSGEQRLILSWTATGEADVESYRIYLSDQDFSPDDADLPEFEVDRGDDGIDSYPSEIEAGAAGSEHERSVEGLSNGLSYWIAVSAVDASGQEGPLGGVLSGTPAATCGAAECSGDPGGCQCGLGLPPRDGGKGSLVAFLGLLLAALPARWRRA